MSESIQTHNIEAEQSVIGAILIEPNAFSTASELITAIDFYRTGHRVVFEAMFALLEKGEPIDMVTVTRWLQDADQLDISGGVPYVTHLAQRVPTGANIRSYCRIVEEKQFVSRLVQTATNIVTTTLSKEDAVAEVLDEAERSILEVSNKQNASAFKPTKDVLIDVYDNIEQLHHAKSDVTGIST